MKGWTLCSSYLDWWLFWIQKMLPKMWFRKFGNFMHALAMNITLVTKIISFGVSFSINTWIYKKKGHPRNWTGHLIRVKDSSWPIDQATPFSGPENAWNSYKKSTPSSFIVTYIPDKQHRPHALVNYPTSQSLFKQIKPTNFNSSNT